MRWRPAQVSSELQDTLKDEMGLDELAEIGKMARGEFPSTLEAPAAAAAKRAVGTGAAQAGAMEGEEELRRMREESARMAWGDAGGAQHADGGGGGGQEESAAGPAEQDAEQQAPSTEGGGEDGGGDAAEN